MILRMAKPRRNSVGASPFIDQTYNKAKLTVEFVIIVFLFSGLLLGHFGNFIFNLLLSVFDEFSRLVRISHENRAYLYRREKISSNDRLFYPRRKNTKGGNIMEKSFVCGMI